MCSIIGGAGDVASLTSRQQHEVHEFLSCLFMCGELRGRDASGFWAWRDNHYVFEKRPIPAQDLVFRSMGWKSLRYNPASLYIMHARATTDGDPNRNINNHPHIGEHSVLVHNGMIWNHEQIARSNNLQLKSECDSEVLLRLAEQKENMTEGVEHMAKVIKQAPSTGSWAIAIVDRRNPNEVVVARNISPLVLYKCPRLKMVFFASTEDIFEKACSILYKDKNPHKLGFEKMAVDVHRIYRLRSDGTVVADKAMTIEDTTYSQYQQNSHHHHSVDSSFRKQPKYAYLYSDIFGFDVEIDPLGHIRGFADSEEHKDAREDIVIERVEQKEDEGVLPEVETTLGKEEIQELIDFVKAI